MPTLNEFIATIKGDGLARENRFEVLISAPFALAGRPQAGELIRMYCQSASLPGVNFLSNPVLTFGEAREVVYNRSFDPVELEFLVDSNMNVKEYFDQWANVIVDPVTRLSSYYNEYVGTVDISQLLYKEGEAEVKYTVRLHEAFPKSMQPIQYTMASKEITKLRVTFQYKYWSVVDSNIVNRQSELDVPDGQSTDTPI